MNIQIPAMTMQPQDRNVVNRTTSLRQAIATRQTVIDSIEKGTANLQAPVQKLVAECLEEVLAEPERIDAFYWCASSADDIEKDIFDRVQRRMKRKMQAGRK